MITQEAEVGAAAVVEGAEDAAEAEDEIKTGGKKILQSSSLGKEQSETETS
jgi:hypothetical protein